MNSPLTRFGIWTICARASAWVLCGLAMVLSACNRPDTEPEQPPVNITNYKNQDFVLVRNNGTSAGRVDLVVIDPASKAVLSRHPTALNCERLHISQINIACLSYRNRLPGAAQLHVYDLALKPILHYPVPQSAVISRTRLSRDGKNVGFTVFVAGHGYTTPGAFETVSMLFDVNERRAVGGTNMLRIDHDGKTLAGTAQTQLNPLELNLWGASFDPTDSNRLMMTVAIAGRPHLAEGSVRDGKIQTIRADIECPAFSPDGSRIAFKKLRADRKAWYPAVLDLRSGQETVFENGHTIDDQIEWLDNDTIVYEVSQTRLGGAKTDLMIRNVRDASQNERLWLENASSPARFPRSGP